jgi:hypothetical protein
VPARVFVIALLGLDRRRDPSGARPDRVDLDASGPVHAACHAATPAAAADTGAKVYR